MATEKQPDEKGGASRKTPRQFITSQTDSNKYANSAEKSSGVAKGNGASRDVAHANGATPTGKFGERRQSVLGKFWRKHALLGYSPLGTHPPGVTINGKDRSKSPVMFAWQHFCDRQPEPREISATLDLQPRSQIGVACGQEGLIVLDADTEDPALQKVILDFMGAIFPDAPLRRGNRARIGAYLLQWDGWTEGEIVPSMKFVDGDGKTIFELLGNGRQVVMPPSAHPSGVPYEMADGEELPPPVDELPKLKPQFVDMLVANIERAGFAIRQVSSARSEELPTPEELRIYEKLIPAKKAVQHTVDFLKSTTKISIEGQRGHDNACRVWQKCADLGCPPDNITPLMWAHWNRRCLPPWSSYDALAAEVQGLLASRRSPIGVNNPERIGAMYFEQPDDAAPTKGAAENAAGKAGSAPMFSNGLNSAVEPRLDKNVELVCLAKVEMEPIRWVWPEYLARKKLHILGGAKGDAKSTIAFRLAATVSTGGEFPDGSRAKVGNVIIWSGEDSVKDTIVPRLVAMGADLNRIFMTSTVTDEDGMKRAFDPAQDLDGLKASIAKIPGGEVALVIIDPLVSAVPADKDSHKNAETRQGLQHVVNFAERYDCAVLGVHHLTKGTRGNAPVERLTGSLAFGAIPRVVLMTATRLEPEEGESPRVFVRAASNIGPSGGGFGYDVEQTTVIRPRDGLTISASRIVWGERIAGAAKMLIDAAETTETSEEKRQPAMTAAKAFLADMLRDGPQLMTEIVEAAEANGHSKATLRRAREKMGVKVRKTASGAWEWALPGDMSSYFEPPDNDA